MRSPLWIVMTLVISIALAFAAMVVIYQQDAPGDSFMERASYVVSDAMTSELKVTQTAPSTTAVPGPTSGVALSPQALAELTSAIRAELRHEAQLSEKSQFWGDVGVSAVFMLLGAMLGELRGFLGMRRR